MKFLRDFAPSVGERDEITSNSAPRGANGLPGASGMYDPAQEHDACGIGFVADLRRPPTHEVVTMGLEILRRLAHRGAAGCDPCSSDGAGILLHVPHAHYERVLARVGVELPLEGDYGVAQCFLSRDSATRAARDADARRRGPAPRTESHRLARRPGRPAPARSDRPRVLAGHEAGLHRAHVPRGRSSSARCS